MPDRRCGGAVLSAPPSTIRVTLAAAGTGKTTFLVDRMVAAIAEGVLPERIVATTFTVPAAAELAERCRARLLADGNVAAAAALAQARLGTTHAVCGRIVEAFAFELGLSPSMQVMSDGSAVGAFARASEAVFARCADRLDALGDAFGAPPGRWRNSVRQIVSLARANGIDAEGLTSSAERSWAELAGFFPVSAGSADGLDAAFAIAVNATLNAFSGVEIHRDSRSAIATLRSAKARIDAGDHVPWPLWAEIAVASVARKDEETFDAVRCAARTHLDHPRLRQDVGDYVHETFACAAAAMEAYVAFKRIRGLVDFEDQERLALEALQREDVAELLRDEIGLVLVDEIQDASPIEVAIYTAFARIAPASVWVGDLKQSVYAFRQADAVLVKAAIDAVTASGVPDALVRSWRARPALCDFVNAVFAPVFDAAGFDRASSRFVGHEDDAGPIDGSPLHVWPLVGRSDDQRGRALAEAIAGLLAAPSDWLVRDGSSIRPAEARDVAILCHRNDEVERVAGALAALGVPVSYDRSDLMGPPEAALLHAALRWVADRSDRLALAEMARMVGGDGDGGPEPWLEAIAATDPDQALLDLLPFAAALESIRARLFGLTAVEVIDAILLETGLLDVVAVWGDGETRLDVLDAMRGRAARYAETRAGEVVTLAGLADSLSSSTDRGRSVAGHGVTVTTWHRAKGREWPIVVLDSLARRETVRLDEPSVETDGALDWDRPLRGRWIRAWPTPYGRRTVGVPLRDAMAESASGRRAAARMRAESVRLLYVGFTRARDHLVFVTGPPSLPWLADLDLDGRRRVVLPNFPGVPLRVDGMDWAVAFRHPRTPAPPRRSPPPLFVAREPRPAVHPPLHRRPSAATGEGPSQMKEIVIGARIPVTGDPVMAHVGEAFHAFVAVDVLGASAREATAIRILARWGVETSLAGADVVLAVDRLRAFLDAAFPGWGWRREVPVSAALGDQIVTGRMDLFGEMGGEFVIVDHKTFPGGDDGLGPRLASANAQLELYADAVSTATGARCVGLFVHLPVLGRVYASRTSP